MATVRKRGGKFQVQIRRQGQMPISKTFLQRADAVECARHMEVKADRGELPAPVSQLGGYSDVGLCSVALAPDLTAWATTEYHQDRDNKTFTVYPIENAECKQVYTDRIVAKFPDHRLIDLGAP